ncbi:MAG: hypothetical protein KGI37_07685 [Alphaproteobacteria bacterium]|nr:hypothetical protein [Alphaproteobacteria bacterium]
MLQGDLATTQVSRAVPTIGPNLLTKVQLCDRLGWTRPRLDRRLESDPHFPVARRGGTGKGRAWQFDFDDVKAHLDGAKLTPDESIDDDGIDPSNIAIDAQRDLNNTAREPFVDVREETARARRDLAQAALMEDKLRQSRGDLVEASDLKDAVSKMLMHLGKGLDALPEQVVSRLNLTAEHALTIRTLINHLRGSMVADLQRILQSND